MWNNGICQDILKRVISKRPTSQKLTFRGKIQLSLRYSRPYWRWVISQTKQTVKRIPFFLTSDFKNSITVSCTDYSFTAVRRWLLYMPTLLDYLWVSQIPHRSPALWYGSPYLPDKIIFWAFLCLGLKFSPFLAQNVNFSYSQYGFWGIFARI